MARIAVIKCLVCLAFRLGVLPPIPLRSQTKAERGFKNCHHALELVGKNWDDDTALLASAREYLTHCSTEQTAPARARLLSRMGLALVHTEQFPESFPILEECASIAAKNDLRGDFTSCLVDHGVAAAHLGNCDLAQLDFKTALDVPTTDNLSSTNHDLAKRWMELLVKAESTGILQLPSAGKSFTCCSEIKCSSSTTDGRKSDH
jgi:hypothetical protein